MKISAVIVAVVFCVAAVSAAPSSSNPSFEQLSASLSDRFQCAYDAVSKLVNDVELKTELDEFRRSMNLLQKEFDVCESKADGKVIAILKCKTEAFKAFLIARNQFMRAVIAKRWELATQIREEVRKCFMNSDFFELETEFSEDSVSEQLSASLSDRIQCAYNVTVKLVNDLELKNELDEFKRSMSLIRKEFEVCESKAEGKVIAILKCKAEAFETYLTAQNKFMRAVLVKRWDLAVKIREEVRKCFMSSDSFELETGFLELY